MNIDECAVTGKDIGPVCLNGGTCLDQVASYKCLCPQGWGGSRCQTAIKACTSSPCLNGARCTDASNAGSSISSGLYQCHCPTGFSGKNCQFNDDDCSPSSCLNGGTCVDGINSISCLCQPGFGGTNCQFQLDKMHATATTDQTKLICRGFDVPLIPSSSGTLHSVEEKNCRTSDPWSKCPNADTCFAGFANGVCDAMCDTKECLFDGMDCRNQGNKDDKDGGRCNQLYDSYCLANYGNGFCDQGCNNRDCGWDGLDCVDNATHAAAFLPGTINITLDTPSHIIETASRQLLTSFLRELSSMVKGSVFELKSRGRDDDTGRAVLELTVNEATCHHGGNCFTRVSEVTDFMAALQSSKATFSHSLPESSLRISSIRAVEEEEENGYRDSPQQVSFTVIACGVLALVVTGVVLGVLYQTNSAGGPMRVKKARGIVWFPENFPIPSGNQRRDNTASRAAGGDFSSRGRPRLPETEMHSLSSNIKEEMGNQHTLLKRKGDKSSMTTLEESIYDEPNEPRAWTLQHLEAFQGRTTTNDYASGQLLSPPVYGQSQMGPSFPGSPTGGVGVDVRGPGGFTPLMVASAFDSKNMFCQQNLVSSSNLFPASPSTLLLENNLGPRNNEQQMDNQIYSPSGTQNVLSPQNDLGSVTNDVISELLASGACLSTQSDLGGETPLHLAARYSRADAAKRLLDAGANCNAVDFAGRTPLHAAIAADARGVFEILLRNRATELDAHAYDGSTPLILAARLACEGMLEDLVQVLSQVPQSPGLDSQDEAGKTALHWAASVDNVSAVRCLISAGANKDSQDNKEETPLFLACREGAFEAAKILLEHGANRDITDHMDRLPRDVALERLHHDIVQLLDEFQPSSNLPLSHTLSPQHNSSSQPMIVMTLPRNRGRKGSTSTTDTNTNPLSAESSSSMSSPPPTPLKSIAPNTLNGVNHSRSQSTASTAKKNRNTTRKNNTSSNNRQQNNNNQQVLLMTHQDAPQGLIPLVPLSPHHIVVTSGGNTYSQIPLHSTMAGGNIYGSSGLLLSPPSSSSPMSSSFSPSSAHTLSPPSHHNHNSNHHVPHHQTSHTQVNPNHKQQVIYGHSGHHQQPQQTPPPAYDEAIVNGGNIYGDVSSYYSTLQQIYAPSPPNHQQMHTSSNGGHHEASSPYFESSDHLAYLTPSPGMSSSSILVVSAYN